MEGQRVGVQRVEVWRVYRVGVQRCKVFGYVGLGC